jgi:hypothetical protein
LQTTLRHANIGLSSCGRSQKLHFVDDAEVKGRLRSTAFGFRS